MGISAAYHVFSGYVTQTLEELTIRHHGEMDCTIYAPWAAAEIGPLFIFVFLLFLLAIRPFDHAAELAVMRQRKIEKGCVCACEEDKEEEESPAPETDCDAPIDDDCPENPYLEAIIRQLEQEKRAMRKENELTRLDLESAQQMISKLVKKSCHAGKQSYRRNQEIEALQVEKGRSRESIDNLVIQIQKLHRGKDLLEERLERSQGQLAAVQLDHDILQRKYDGGIEAGKRLQEKAVHYQKTADEQTLKAQTATARANDLQKRFAAKQDALAKTNAQLEQSTAKLDTLHGIIDEYNGEIAGLRTMLTDQSEELHSTRDRLKEAGEQYEVKKKNLTRNFNLQAEEASYQYWKLQDECHAIQAKLDNSAKMHAVQLFLLRDVVEDRERSINTLRSTLSKRDQILSKLEAKAQKLHDKTSKQKTTIAGLEKDFLLAEALTQRLNGQIKGLQDRNKHVEAGIRPKDDRIAMYEQDLTKAWHDLADKKRELADSAEKLREAEGRVLQKDVEIEKLQEVVESLDHAVANGEEAAFVDAKDGEETVDVEEVEGVEDEIETGTETEIETDPMDDNAIDMQVGEWQEVDEVDDEDEEGLGREEWNKEL